MTRRVEPASLDRGLDQTVRRKFVRVDEVPVVVHVSLADLRSLGKEEHRRRGLLRLQGTPTRILRQDLLDAQDRPVPALGGGLLLDLREHLGDQGPVLLGRQIGEGRQGLELELVARRIVVLLEVLAAAGLVSTSRVRALQPPLQSCYLRDEI